MLVNLLILSSCGLLVAILGAVAIKIVACQLARVRFKQRTRGLPIMPGGKLIGNHAAELFLGDRNCQKLLESHQKLGTTIGWLRSTEFCVSTTDLDLIKTFVFDEPSRHLNRLPLDVPMKEINTNISTAHMKEWQHLRRIVAPALAPNKFKTPNVEQEIEESVDRLIRAIEFRLGGQPPEADFNADDYFARYAMNLICKCFYKQDRLIGFKRPRDPAVHRIESAMSLARTSFFVRLTLTFPKTINLIDWLGERFTKIGAARRMVLEFVRKQTQTALEARKQLHQLKREAKEKGVRINPNDFLLKDGTRFRRNMIDHIMDHYLDGKLTTTHFMHNSVFFMLAGFRTAADCLIHSLYLLSVHQNVQDQLRESIKRDGIDSDLLDWVFKESLRLLPPAPIGCSRTVTRDMELASGHLLPKGTFVLTNAYVIHRLKEYWGEDADEFRPERWQDTSHHHPMQYIPFGAGLRGCPGKHFAIYEMKKLFVPLLSRYKFTGEPRADVYEFDCPFFLYILPNSATRVRVSRV